MCDIEFQMGSFQWWCKTHERKAESREEYFEGLTEKIAKLETAWQEALNIYPDLERLLTPDIRETIQ